MKQIPMVAAWPALLASGLVLLSSTGRAQAGDRQACARKLTLALQPPNPATAEALLKQGYADCGDGHGFLGAMAMAAAGLGDTERAAELCLRELRADKATDRAVEVFLSLYPRVSAATRRKMLELGTTPDAPINVPSSIIFARLVEQVYCEGSRLIGMPESYDSARELFRISVECPRGKVTPRYVRYPERARSSGPAARRAIDRLIEESGLGDKFGTGSAAELRARISGPVTDDRSLAWLLGSIPDPLREKAVWALLAKKHPNDLEVILSLATSQAMLGEREQALKTLRAADPKKAELVDARGAAVSPSAIFTLQCRILLRQNKLSEANAACARAIALGSKRYGPIAFAEVLYLQGKYEAALAQVENSLGVDERSQRAFIVAALINQKLGRSEAAKAQFDGSFGLSVALHASLDDQRTPAQWLALLDHFEDVRVAYSLAQCGHHYLDLELPKLSEACFAASEKIDPFPAKVTRLEHQAEADPSAALKAAPVLLSRSDDAELLQVVARAHAQAGAPHEGIPALRKALYLLAPWELPDELIQTVCVDEPLAACMKLAP